MKFFNTFLIGGTCLLFSITVTALNTSNFPNSTSYCSYSTAILFDSSVENPKTITASSLNPNKLDDDKDGVSNSEDCAPLNPALPGIPGTPCNDNNDFTKNDKIQADACTCSGTTMMRDTPITIDLGEDRLLALNEKVTITTSVLQYNTCIVTTCSEETPLIAHWNMNTQLNSLAPNSDFCATVVTKGLYRKDGNPLKTSKSYSKKAVTLDMVSLDEFQNNHSEALRFDIVVDPTADISRITKLTFMEKAKAVSNSKTPTRYGIRILKGGKEIYKAIDMMTNTKWTEAIFDFSNEPIFEVSSTAIFTVELIAYTSENTPSTPSVWNIDDIKIFGGCCNTSSFQSSRYLWSTGARTNSISVDQPGNYMVTVTDCNGTTAVDEVVVDRK